MTAEFFATGFLFRGGGFDYGQYAAGDVPRQQLLGARDGVSAIRFSTSQISFQVQAKVSPNRSRTAAPESANK
jgi:hypothetical protein